MNPVERSKKIAKKYEEYFRNPLDENDAAARILDPVITIRWNIHADRYSIA